MDCFGDKSPRKDGKREVIIARIYGIAKWRPVSSLRENLRGFSWQSILSLDSAESLESLKDSALDSIPRKTRKSQGDSSDLMESANYPCDS